MAPQLQRKAVVVESLAGDLCQEGGCSTTPLFYEGGTLNSIF